MYIYFGKYFHRHGKDISNLNEIKVGRTVDLAQRESQLNNTKMTIGYTIVKAFETGDDTNKVEKQLHAILPNRLDGEWFDQDNEDQTLIARGTKFMAVSGYPEVDLGLDSDEDVNKVRKEEKDWVEWREFFEKKTEEHPEWFKIACRNWAYSGLMFSNFNIIIGGNTSTRTSTKEVFDLKVELKGKPLDDELSNYPEVTSMLREILGSKFVERKFYCRAVFDTFDEAFEHYKKIVTAGKEGDINLNKEDS
jgi:hypothetical protein